MHMDFYYKHKAVVEHSYLYIGILILMRELCWLHDDVIKWKHFPLNWPFVREIHRSPVNFPHKGQWHGALMFSLIYAWINDWVNNREAGDLRRQHGHYDVIVMLFVQSQIQYPQISWISTINTMRPQQNCHHFADDTFKRIFLNENVRISIKNPLKFVSKDPINYIPSSAQIMAWCRPGDKPLSEPMMVRLPTHICVTRPQWVNTLRPQQMSGILWSFQ